MLTLARIQAWALRSPTETPVETSFGVMRDRPAVLVRIEDPDGAFGWGEVFANWPAAGAEHRVRLLEMDIAPLVLGRHYDTPDALFGDLSARTHIRAVQCGEAGPFAQVTAGLDTALWDMAARRAGVPLRKLICPDAPDRVPVYASGIHIAAAAPMMAKSRAAGHQRFKLKVGFEMGQDVDQLQAAVDDLAPHEQLACDANQAWTLEDAITFTDRTCQMPLLWLEEPMPVFAATADWQSLAARAQVPLAGGENVLGQDAFADWIANGALRVLQPDLAKWGGITGCLHVARAARAAGLTYCPHFLGAGLGLAASAELLAAVGGTGLLELDVNANPLRSEVFEGAEPVNEGTFACSTEPGLGISHLPKNVQQLQTLAADLSLCR